MIDLAVQRGDLIKTHTMMEVQIYGIDLAKDKFDVNYFDAKKQKCRVQQQMQS